MLLLFFLEQEISVFCCWDFAVLYLVCAICDVGCLTLQPFYSIMYSLW